VPQAEAPKVVQIESYPTPIGKTVEGKEAHFQLSRGRIVFVPFDAFGEKLHDRLRELAMSTDNRDSVTDVLGPIGGFRMRYTLEKFETQHGTMVGSALYEMIPTSNELGEPIESALAADSQFRKRMQMISPHQYTITIWTYPDSFAAYRQLKKELYALGYQVAARPMKDGTRIAGSPYGSKSSAQ
jgi:hypothetical protein